MERRPGSVLPSAAAVAVAVLSILVSSPEARSGTTLLDRTGVVDGPFVPAFARAIASSPGGEHVYVTDTERDVIFVFARDGIDGALTLVETEPGISNDIVVTSDGLHLYSLASPVVRIYARDATTGALAFSEIENVFGNALLASPDGAYLFAFGTSGVTVYARDAVTGGLTLGDSEPAHGTTFLLDEGAISADGAHLYMPDNLGRLQIYEHDPVGGTIANVGSIVDLSAVAAATSPDGEHVYVCSDSPDAILVYERDPATGALSAVETEGLPGSCGAGFSVSFDGSHVYAIDRSSSFVPGTISVLARDSVTGELTFLESVTDRVAAARDLKLAPDGAHAYAIERGATRIFARDAGTGSLTFVDGLFSFEDTHSGAASPDGSHVYLAAESAGSVEDRLGTFSRDPVSGALTLVDTEFDGAAGVEGLRGARQVVLSADGAHLYTVSRNDDLAVFDRDPITGALDFVESQPAANASWSVALSPDGAHVYAGPSNSAADGTLDVFARNAATGALTLVESEPQVGRAVIACSPDGEHLYAATGGDLSVFDRNAATGEISLVATATLPGGEARAIVASPDGRHLYVGSDGGDDSPGGRLHVLRRDPGTGEVTLAATMANGSASVGFYELDTIAALEMHPEGTYVFATGLQDEAIVSADRITLHVFRRDADTGLLAFVQAEIDAGAAPLPGLEVPLGGVVASPEGAHVYWIGVADTPVADVYAPGFGCAEVPLGSCRSAEKAKVALDERLLDFKDRFSFTWAKGDSTSAAEFDPGTDNHFALCGYDESGVTPELVFGALAPAGEDCRLKAEADPKPCWSTTAKLAKLKDPSLSPDGIDFVTLKSGADGKASIGMRGRSDHLRLPDLPLGLPVRIQLQAASGLCWESVFVTASRNDASGFGAKAD